ncbi:MAG: RidA family protein [Acidobacteriota bacterium]|nr:RidA family protein [Acidobacteriota bacterium]
MRRVACVVALLVIAFPVFGGEEVEKEYIDPEQGFTQVVTAVHNGLKTVWVSGQIGWAADASEPGADLAAQAEIAFASVLRRLEQAGASLDDVVKTTVFLKDIDPDKVRTAGGAQAKAYAVEKYPASTWVGVTGLVDPRLLIEVEATAVIAVD